jgi:hypothetical protein
MVALANRLYGRAAAEHHHSYSYSTALLRGARVRFRQEFRIQTLSAHQHTSSRTWHNGGKLPGHGGVGQYVTALCAATSLADIITGGSFGKVYKAVDRRTGEIVAIKHVGASPPMQDQTAHPP